ncbi:hypothetical protein [Syntrophomonas curvata]
MNWQQGDLLVTNTVYLNNGWRCRLESVISQYLFKNLFADDHEIKYPTSQDGRCNSKNSGYNQASNPTCAEMAEFNESTGFFAIETKHQLEGPGQQISSHHKAKNPWIKPNGSICFQG